MSARNRLNQLLSSVSQFGLALDDNDSCQIRCTNGLVCVVELMPGTERALGYIPITRLPTSAPARSAMMQTALTLNLDFVRKNALSLVYDWRMDSIVLCAVYDLQDPVEAAFDQWLTTLIESSTPVQRRIVEAEDPSMDGADSSAGASSLALYQL